MSKLYRIAVCDNENIWLKQIECIIETYFSNSDNEVSIDLFDNSECFLKTDLDYEVLFLDIEMPVINGIELKNKLENNKLNIIFVTSYKGYMEQAFGKNVIGYIAKDELYKIADVLQKIEESEQDYQTIDVAGKIICTKNILYLEGEGNYTKVIMLEGESVLCSIPINKLLDKLNNKVFTRIHKKYAVNMKHISRINYKNVILFNSTCVTLARSHVNDFKETYYKYLKD